jgi:LmbE family N-acetylglucosaminyl deacetylase
MYELTSRLSQHPVLCLSPHTDDLAYSMGGLIAAMHAKTSLSSVNVFCTSIWAPNIEAKGPETISSIRREEDLIFCGKYRITAAYWETPDSGCRGYDKVTELSTAPELDPVWPDVAHRIAGLLRTSMYHIIFAPLALGGHVDHQIVRDAILRSRLRRQLTVFYEDVPYCSRLNLMQIERIVSTYVPSAIPVRIAIDIDQKLEDMRLYFSQTRQEDLDAACIHAQRRGSPNGFSEQFWILEDSAA